MYTVYVLYSSKFKKIYIGYTSNLQQRLLSHNLIANKGYTTKFRPWNVIYTEIFDLKNLAIIREKQLKTAKGRLFIWELINSK
ncbi:GIY-YIG nuclease family protein [Pedobacter flavus]|uniref:GIY-YIG nuclease family protein n=1 Tax=Pedobacter flavus TaxID=3113906 RepID=A0ABU7H161_9SPHI|nr:GIY-YIG nuclease family protein [Pedobacter sp. VNH31]MEE1884976.1 GIY-YIG nuclease family protein [Pedobacter sp. VNH31]